MRSFADWYSSGNLAPFVVEQHELGSTPVSLMATRQLRGDLSDPPVSDLVISFILRRPVRLTCDLGAGRFRKTFQPGEAAIIAPGVGTRITADDDSEVAFLSLPGADLAEIIGEDNDCERVIALCGRPLRSPLIAPIWESLRAEATVSGTCSRLFADSAVTCLLAHLSCQDARPTASQTSAALPEWRLHKAMDLMAARIGEDVSLAELAAAAGLSRFHLSRAFKATTGLSPLQWLAQLRVARAQDMLRVPGQSITGIALSLGYSSHSAFGAAFRRETGMTPRAWREAVLK